METNESLKCGDILCEIVNNSKIYSLGCPACSKVFKSIDKFLSHIAMEHDSSDQKNEVDISKTLNCTELVEEVQVGEEHLDSEENVEEAAEIEQIIIYNDNNDEYDEDYSTTNEDLNDDESDDKSSDPLADQNALKLAIIVEYEKHPVLWNCNLSSRKSRPMREKALATIAKSVNKKLELQITVNEVTTTLNMIATCYRNELLKQKLAQLNGEERNPPWYFEKLKFLQQKKATRKNNVTRSIGLPLRAFDDQQHSEFFAIYKEFPLLWNVYDVGFYTKDMRKKAIDNMLKVVSEKMSLDLTPLALKRKLYEIRYSYSKEKYQKLECERLQKPFKSMCKYLPEIEFLEPHVQPFNCPYCDKVFGIVRQYLYHRSEHEGSLPFKCSFCNQGFKIAHYCLQHMRQHTKELPYTCKLCGKSFAKMIGLTLHLRRHKGERPFVCEICGKSFFKETLLSYHKRRHTNERPFVCTVCSKAFFENSLLKEHMASHLNLRDKVCNICGKTFNKSKHLLQHKKTHDKKKYSCTICGKDFSQNTGLWGHMKTHNVTKEEVFEVNVD